MNLNSLPVIRRNGNTKFTKGRDLGGGGGISPKLSREMQTWTRNSPTFQQRKLEKQGGHSSGKKLHLYAFKVENGI